MSHFVKTDSARTHFWLLMLTNTSGDLYNLVRLNQHIKGEEVTIHSENFMTRSRGGREYTDLEVYENYICLQIKSVRMTDAISKPVGDTLEMLGTCTSTWLSLLATSIQGFINLLHFDVKCVGIFPNRFLVTVVDDFLPVICSESKYIFRYNNLL